MTPLPLLGFRNLSKGHDITLAFGASRSVLLTVCLRSPLAVQTAILLLLVFHRPNPPSSRAVLASWWALHSGCQLSLSQNFTRSPLCGTTWSTTVAAVIRPSAWHIRHNGLSRRYRARALRQSTPYPRSADVPRCRSYALACSGQKRSVVSAEHPGRLHGFFGLLGMSYPRP